jgi:hypothetical protein
MGRQATILVHGIEHRLRRLYRLPVGDFANWPGRTALVLAVSSPKQEFKTGEGGEGGVG